MVSNLPTEYSCDIVLFQCAHPSNVYFSINYDKNCSNEIKLTDLVDDVDALVKMCKNGYKEQCSKEIV